MISANITPRRPRPLLLRPMGAHRANEAIPRIAAYPTSDKILAKKNAKAKNTACEGSHRRYAGVM